MEPEGRLPHRKPNGASPERNAGEWGGVPILFEAFADTLKKARQQPQTTEGQPQPGWEFVWVDPPRAEPSPHSPEERWMGMPRRLLFCTREAVAEKLHKPLLVPFVTDGSEVAARVDQMVPLIYKPQEGWQAADKQAAVTQEVVSGGSASFSLSPLIERDIVTEGVVDCLVFCALGTTRKGGPVAFLAHVWPGIFVEPERSGTSPLTNLHLSYWQYRGEGWEQQLLWRRALFARLFRERLQALRDNTTMPPRFTLTLGGFLSRSHTFGNLLAQLEAAKKLVAITREVFGEAAAGGVECLPPVGQVRSQTTGEWYPGVHAVGVKAREGKVVVALPRGQYLEQVADKEGNPPLFLWQEAREVTEELASRLRVPQEALRVLE